MNFSTPSHPTEQVYGSQRYHYMYGRHQQYGSTAGYRSYPSGSLAGANLRFLTPEPLDRPDAGPQTVEQLIDQGYFAPARQESELGILDDRKQTSWMALDDVIGQIRQRHEIYEQNMLDIQWGQCYAFNEMALGGWPTSDEKRALYERRMQDLSMQERAERVNFWRDSARLRERLPESVQQYLSAFRKLEILGDQPGDLP